ncbi:MAG: hypothetical protein ACRDJN_13655 [Chloroflexota bacterium]
MLALSRTRLTLVVAAGVGHDPIRATGLVMVSLGQIARQVAGAPQIFVLKPPELGRHRTDPAAQLTKIAQHRNVPRHELIAAERAHLEGLP